MAEVAALNFRAAELIEDQVVVYAPLLLMRNRLMRVAGESASLGSISIRTSCSTLPK